jgi:hypothetical protein
VDLEEVFSKSGFRRSFSVKNFQHHILFFFIKITIKTKRMGW